MAVLPEAHHQGVGRSLMGHANKWLKRQNIQYLQVKTLGPSDPDKSYAKTRLFYEAVGFIPLEEFKQIWDEDNPCLITVKKLEEKSNGKALSLTAVERDGKNRRRITVRRLFFCYQRRGGLVLVTEIT